MTISKWLPKPAEPKWPLPDKPSGGWRFPTGAYVKDEKGTEYFVPASQAEAFQMQVEDKSVSDQGFWEWFAKFRKDYYIFASYKWKGAKSGRGMSGWWQYDLHNAFGGAGSNIEKKLTLALRAVNTTVRIVDDSTPPYTVGWAEEGMSATDVVSKRIIINPKPITKPGTLTSTEAIDITTGFGLHEAGHAKYTSKVFKPMETARPEPWKVAMFLGNTVEDIRTEALTSKEYPGFAGYFTVALDYVWNDMDIEAHPEMLPVEWGKDLTHCLNAILMTLKWPSHAKRLLTHPSFIDEMPWWEAWCKSYQNGSKTLLETVEEGIARLRMNSGVDEQMQQMGRDGKLPAGVGEPCVGHVEDGEALEGEMAASIREKIEENLREWTPKTDHGSEAPSITIRRPNETPHSKKSYIGKPHGLTNRLKSILQFRPELPKWNERLLKTGTIAEDELYRHALGDYRVFERQVIETYPNAQVALLVDMSGSMNGSVGIDTGYGPGRVTKLNVAQDLTQLFVSALAGMDGVVPRVYGHTGDLDTEGEPAGTAEFYELWEPGDPMPRIGLITSMEHGDNFDGYAIEWVTERLLAEGGPTDQRLLVVMSDGYPAGHGYGDFEGEQHVGKVTAWAEKQGVFVLQIAIDNSVRPETQARMFKHWLPYESVDALPRQLTKALSAFLNRS